MPDSQKSQGSKSKSKSKSDNEGKGQNSGNSVLQKVKAVREKKVSQEKGENSIRYSSD